MAGSVLDPSRVNTLYEICVANERDDPSTLTGVVGVAHTYYFSMQRLDHHHEEIRAMLRSLPEEFADWWGGWSVLVEVMEQSGATWKSFHASVDRLYRLGLAIEAAVFRPPIEQWGALNGAQPWLQRV